MKFLSVGIPWFIFGVSCNPQSISAGFEEDLTPTLRHPWEPRERANPKSLCLLPSGNVTINGDLP